MASQKGNVSLETKSRKTPIKLSKEYMGLLLNETGDLATANTDKAKVSNVYFASVFTMVSHTPVISERNREDLPATCEDSAKDYFR